MPSFPPTEVRPAESDDLPALQALFDRCSPETRYRRFHGGAATAHRRELERVSRPASDHRSWVAVDADGAVHGTATLARGPGGQADVAFLVEDAWFRRGIGRALFAAMAATAVAQRESAVVATLLADNERAVRFLRAVAPGAQFRYLGFTELEVVVPVPATAAGPGPASRQPAGAGAVTRPAAAAPEAA
ncbi:MAG: GNAT family N-acetyltransferase [Acidimicrobiales bacterium]|nr:GNAT family N-acetyltransferase [Acidimicrobiales bacterium]